MAIFLASIFLLLDSLVGTGIPIPATDRHSAPTIPVEIGWLETDADAIYGAHESIIMNAFIDVQSTSILLPDFLIPEDQEYQVIVMCFSKIDGDESCHNIPRARVEFYDPGGDEPVTIGLAPGSFFRQIFGGSFTIAPATRRSDGHVLWFGSMHNMTTYSHCSLNSSAATTTNTTPLSNVSLSSNGYFGLAVNVNERIDDMAVSPNIQEGFISTFSANDWVPRQVWDQLVSVLLEAEIEVSMTSESFWPFVGANCDLSRFPTLWYRFFSSDIGNTGFVPAIDIALYPEDYTVRIDETDACRIRLMPDRDAVAPSMIGWNLLQNVVTHFGDNFITFCDPPDDETF